MSKNEKSKNRLVAVGMTLTLQEKEDLVVCARDYSMKVNLKVTPQKFLIKLLYDYISKEY